MTLNSVIAIILCYYAEDARNFKANCFRLIEADPMLSATKNCSPKTLVFVMIYGDIRRDYGERLCWRESLLSIKRYDE